MTSNADLGQVIQFVEQCFQIEGAEELAKAILNVTNNIQLNIILNITVNEESFWFSSNGQTTPLEVEVMTMLKDKRHNDFGTRTVVNYENISLMIKNMPLEDPDRYGRIKDLIPAILSTANGKIDNINSGIIIQQQTMEIIRTFEMMNQTLNGLFDKSNENRSQIETLLRKMFEELQTKVPYMGLDEDQEEYILERVDSAIIGVTKTNEDAEAIIASIGKVLGDLEDLATSQRKLSEWLTRTNKKGIHDQDEEDDSAVQLF